MDIAVDLDGIIANPYPILADRVINQLGAVLPFDKWHDPVFENLFPTLDRGWIGRQFSDPAFWESVDVFPESLDWLEGHRIKNTVHIVTARPKNTAKATKLWLRKKGVPYHHIHHVPREDKHEMLHIIRAKFMVEDDPRNALKISQSGIKCYIMTMPYNLHHDIGKSIRIDSLREIEE